MKIFDSNPGVLNDIFEKFYDLYVETSIDGIIGFVSPSIKKILGYDPEELVGKNAEELYTDIVERKQLIHDILQKRSQKS